MTPSAHEQTSGDHLGGAAFSDFVELIRVLRSPEGCPWDREQTHESLTSNMIEEAYEAVDAIESGDTAAIREELGDVALQVVLHAQIAAEAGTFNIDDVISGIHNKIVHRHPHVFTELDAADSPEEVTKLWADIKRKEKLQKSMGLFDSLSFSQPALLLASDVSKKAVAAGFEWEAIKDVREKLDEELAELAECEPGSDEALEEMGDVLFTAVNLARKYRVNPEAALRATCRKFTARWAIMERYATEQGLNLSDMGVDEQEKLWQKAKEELKN